MPFTTQQQAVIDYPLKPLSVIAGPGTGKTQTLLGRVVRLIQTKQCVPHKILIVTFTTKAADELRQRLYTLVGNLAETVTVTTLHALGWNIVQQHQPVTLITAEQRQTILKQFKDQPQVELHLSQQAALYPLSTDTILKQYQQAVQQLAVVDYDDLIRLPIELFEQKPNVLADYQERWQCICVDEAQDLNPMQWRLITLLAQRYQAITLVGDPDQSIYGFRGVTIAGMVQAKESFPELHQIILDQSFRCPSSVLAVAQQLIQHNPNRIAYTLSAATLITTPVWPITTISSTNARVEAKAIVHEIKQLLGGTSMETTHTTNQLEYNLNDIVILGRTAAVLELIQEQCLQGGLPTQLVSDKPFFELPSVQAALKYIRQLDHTTMTTLSQAVADYFTTQTETLDLEQLYYLTTMYDHDSFIVARQKLEERIVLDHEPMVGAPQRNVIRLMTIHAAKGLEFPVVFLVGLEAGTLPHRRAVTVDEIAEERRLLYVALTRAQQRLYLCQTQQRYQFGQLHQQTSSLFWDELPTTTFVPLAVKLPIKKAKQLALI